MWTLSVIAFFLILLQLASLAHAQRSCYAQVEYIACGATATQISTSTGKHFGVRNQSGSIIYLDDNSTVTSADVELGDAQGISFDNVPAISNWYCLRSGGADLQLEVLYEVCP